MKKSIVLIAVLMLTIVATACGKDKPVDVMKELQTREIPSYKVSAEMTVNSGTTPQKYMVDVSFKGPDYYKVDIKNESSNGQQQVILKNKHGVYVINPLLNKMFKFQSEWPDNGGQSYIYQALIKDIISDKNVKMTVGKKNYIFETKTRYAENKNIPTQKIALDKKTLAPKKVTIFDSEQKELIVVDFGKMELNPKFEKGDFSSKKILASSQENAPKQSSEGNKFTVKYPAENVAGAGLVGEKYVGDKVVMTFEGGDKSYTLIERKSIKANSPLLIKEIGEPINLGTTIGTLTENAVTWTSNGVDYMVASDNLTQGELVEVASSVYISPEK